MRQQPIGRVVADPSMPGMNGLELIRRIRLLHPAVPVLVLVLVLVLSMHALRDALHR